MLYFCGVINKQNKHGYKYMAILPITILNFYIMSNVLEAKKVKKVQTIKEVAEAAKIEQLKKELTQDQIMALIDDKAKALILGQQAKLNQEKRQLAKANQSELSKSRNKLNQSVKATLLNYDDVFATVIKKEFSLLTSRPTLQKVNEHLNECIGVLFGLCSDNFMKLYKEEKKTIIWGRLPRLVTDKKLLFTFATEVQKSNGKIWGATQIIDLLFKALTVKDNAYELALKVRK